MTRLWGPDDGVALGVTAAALVLLGAPVGLLWAAVAPRVPLTQAAGGGLLVDTRSEALIGADGALLALLLVVGAASGVVAARLAGRQQVGVVLGLAAGGLLAAVVAAATGQLVGDADAVALGVVAGAAGQPEAFLELRARGVLLVWPALACGAFQLTTLLRGR